MGPENSRPDNPLKIIGAGKRGQEELINDNNNLKSFGWPSRLKAL
jgi:hypothetical protein